VLVRGKKNKKIILGQAKQRFQLIYVCTFYAVLVRLGTKTILEWCMEKNERLEKLDFLKKRLKRKFAEMEEPMKQIEFTRKNYDKLFPDNKVSTPIGKITLRNDQFKKLKIKKRQNLLGAMHQTLTDPIAIINEDRKGEKAKLFSKSFLENKKPIVSVVIKEKDKNTVISTHDRKINNILNKIKKPADLIFEKQTNGVMGPAGDDSYSLNLAVSGDTQSTINLPQIPPNVKVGN